MTYTDVDRLLSLVNEPAQSICRRIMSDHRTLFERARGSTYNHQTWDGGYLDHVTDGMNFACSLYGLLLDIGRPLPFSLSDALLVFFLHDLEKPWRIVVAETGEVVNRPGLTTKAEFKAFRESELARYGLQLTPAQRNALTYVEGEGQDYSSKRRVMNELAAFCHMVDTWSARGWYDYPKPAGEDEWSGAQRFRSIASGNV